MHNVNLEMDEGDNYTLEELKEAHEGTYTPAEILLALEQGIADGRLGWNSDEPGRTTYHILT